MSSDLEKLRRKIDAADRELLAVLAKRMKLVKTIGAYKRIHHLKPLDRKRWNEVLKTRVAAGRSKHLSPQIIRKLFALIHRNSVAVEKKV